MQTKTNTSINLYQIVQSVCANYEFKKLWSDFLWFSDKTLLFDRHKNEKYKAFFLTFVITIITIFFTYF